MLELYSAMLVGGLIGMFFGYGLGWIWGVIDTFEALRVHKMPLPPAVISSWVTVHGDPKAQPTKPTHKVPQAVVNDEAGPLPGGH